ncbi:MAG: helical backbone metal receptor, partial [Burkholderiales bacterium]
MTTNTLRIVSLVPSITETLSALGLADAIVGRTGFCIHPREIMRQIPKVGGTKDIDLAKIRALAPTHVVMNVEENRREDYDAIQAFCPNVLATYPQTPADNIELYRTLGTAFDRRGEAESLVTRFTAALESAQDTARAWPIERVLYLIWRDPWMSVARETYISRMLAVVNWETAPTPSAIRYPTIDLAATTTDVARVLLSS